MSNERETRGADSGASANGSTARGQYRVDWRTRKTDLINQEWYDKLRDARARRAALKSGGYDSELWKEGP